MSENVDRLKALLFDTEAEALQRLALRLDAQVELDARARADLKAHLEALLVHERKNQTELKARIEAVQQAERQSQFELAQRLEALHASERQAKADLQARLAATAEAEQKARQALLARVDGMAQSEAAAREDLRRRIDAVFAKVGTNEDLTRSVADVLSAALNEAEVRNHHDLSNSIAPLVVSTIKTELRNSQDEMVEALYPITGRLVKSYVASAIKDLTDEINRRLEQNPVMLRLQSMMTGRPVGEIALAGANDFAVSDVYLIRRGTGELLARWPDTPHSGREQALSGVLAAINEFANEAFAADQSSLRQIDLGGEEVYLRASPLYLLAARCQGTAPANFDQIIDDAFLAAVERQHDIHQAGEATGERTNEAARNAASLAELGETLESRMAAARQSARPAFSGRAVMKVLATLILLPLLSWYAYSWYAQWAESSVRETARTVVAEVSQMAGYPTEFDVAPLGRRLIISGLAPSQATKTETLRRLTQRLGGTDIQDRLTVIAGTHVVSDPTPELDKVRAQVTSLESGLKLEIGQRSVDRAILHVEQASADLARAAANTPEAGLKPGLANLADATADLRLDLQRARAGALASTETPAKQIVTDLDGLSATVRARADEVAALTAAPRTGKAAAATSQVALAASATPAAAAERLAAEADRLSTLSQATALAANAARPAVPVPAVLPPPPAAPSPREKLIEWARANAIFFGNMDDYRSADVAARQLQELAAHLKAGKLMVRAIGYTDDMGGLARNALLAQQRADRVRRDLLALGVPADAVVAVGRAENADISPAKGLGSPNRRVQFEVAYEGEPRP